MSNIVMTGTDGDDVLVGVDGDNTWFKGYDGNDTLVGANGNDVFEGGLGADVMIGGEGNDVFFYTGGASPVGDTIDGGAGYDTVQFTSPSGSDLYVSLHDSLVTNVERIEGGDGNDNFYGADLSAGITMSGGAGRDYLQGGTGDDFLYGGTGSDTLQGNGGNDIMYGGDGEDYFEYMSGQAQGGDTIDGGDGFDTVDFYSDAGTARHVDVGAIRNVERIFGGDGDDTMDASSTTAGIILDTGAGQDVLLGGSGNDVLAGGTGHDVISGGAGDDVIYYYLPGDTPAGDTIDGGDGFDEISFYTEAGTNSALLLDDAMRTNIEQVSGGNGNEYIDGRDLTSGITLSGNGGSDYLVGGHGDDILVGGDGHDFLKGGAGHDILTGGAGDDIFVMGGDAGTWAVTDFTQGLDHIQVSDAYDFDYLMQHAAQVGDDTQITIDGMVMILQHVQLSSLAQSDFFFGL